MRRWMALFGTLMCLALWNFGREIEGVWMTVYHPEREREGERVLILDAGHGGEDGGASSAAGDKESDINLHIVWRMEQIFGFCGVKTMLTRREDISIHDESAESIREKKVSDLRNRVALIERYGKALLSVHQNAYPDPRYSGAQVFYRESELSRQWAEETQEMLCLTLKQTDHRQARPISKDIYLMNQVSCPAILAECGFLSNGVEASLLVTEVYQTKTALALVGAYVQRLNDL